jgi:hypothetical protein
MFLGDFEDTRDRQEPIQIDVEDFLNKFEVEKMISVKISKQQRRDHKYSSIETANVTQQREKVVNLSCCFYLFLAKR